MKIKKGLKIGAKVASIAHIAFWLFIAIISIKERLTYTTNPNYDALVMEMGEFALAMFVVLSMLGMLSAVMLSLSLFAFLGKGQLRKLKTASLIVSIVNVLWFYAELCVLHFGRRIAILFTCFYGSFFPLEYKIILVAGIVLFIASAVLLIALGVSMLNKKTEHSKDGTEGAFPAF